MSLPRAFQRKVRAVRVRCSLILLLRQAGRVLAATGVVAVVAVVAERLLAVPAVTPWGFWVFWGVAVAALLVLWLFRLPSPMEASLLLDERLKLHERSSTTLALADSEDPFARAARAESLRAVLNADLRGHLPIRLSRSWYYGAGVWLVAGTMVLCLPQKDLLGLLQRKLTRERERQQVAQARIEVKATTELVKAVVKKLDDPNLAEKLTELDEIAKDGRPLEIKRETIKKLGDLSEKLEQMQARSELQVADVLQQMLKQLRGSTDPVSQELRMSLAKGDFAKAAEMLREMQRQLSEGSLPGGQREQLAEQLQQLARELKSLAEQQRQIEGELEKLGLDKSLANVSPEQLRQALQKQGFRQELIDQLASKIEASQSASAQCSALGQGLAGLGAGGDGLADAIGQLDALDALQQQAVMLRVSLEEISRGMGGLGEGMGEGHWQIGEGGGHGKGIGLSPGSHEITSDPLAADKTARASTRSDGRDPVVASWYFRDAPVRGEAQRTFSEVVQAGRAGAAEAISENQIPRRYEDAVKSYFSQLEESGPKP